MIEWPDLKLPPINLWSLPYVNQRRPQRLGMEGSSLSKPRQSGDQRNRGRTRSTHTQSTNLWATIKTYR